MSWPVGQPHASATVFPVARLGRVAIFVLSRARVVRDVFSARSGPAPGARDGALPACLPVVCPVAHGGALPARRAPRGARRCPACPLCAPWRATVPCLPVVRPVARDGALSRRGPTTGARDGALSRRGPAPGAREGASASPRACLRSSCP
ncbi:unnamed protein product [Closterium sp. NIES-54]